MHDHYTERRGTRLAVKFFGALALASIVVLLIGASSWLTLHSAGNEIRTMRLAAGNGDMTAVADNLLVRIDRSGLRLAGGVFVAVALLGGIYLYFIRTVVQPLQENVRLASRLASGDCDENVSAPQLARNDELGELARAVQRLVSRQREEAAIANDMSAGDFSSAAAVRGPADTLRPAIRRMADATVGMFRRVDAHVGQLMAGCEDIASASGGLSANGARIAGAVTEISSGIARIRTHADDNAGMAEQAGKLAVTGSKSVERGYEDIGEMGVVMLNMQVCGDKIVQIAKSIGDIAFQTNLLSLNASVEAARAGRNGKGFTIVAEEVRNLAVRSSKAAEETSTLMQETVQQVELAAAIAGRINATFGEMQTNIRDADALMGKIAVASNEQSGGIDRISAALRQVDRSVQENAEHAGAVLEKADGLARETGRLRQMLGRVRLDSGRPPNYETLTISAAATPAVRSPGQSAALPWNQ